MEVRAEGRGGRVPRAVGRLVAVGAALVLAAVLVGAAELALRAAGWHERGADFRLPGNHAAAFDASGQFRRHPRRFFTTAPGHRASPEHAGRYATGEWPFRGRPAEPLPPGAVHVAVLGDSCVYGEGVSTSASLPERIQQELAARGLGAERVVVSNFGVPGYSTLQIRMCLARVLERFRPDAVVLYPAAWNDQAPSLGRTDAELLGEGARPLVARLLPALSNAWAQLEAQRSPPDFEAEREALRAAYEAGEPRVPAGEVRREVARMLELCRGSGAAPVVVVPPHPLHTLEEFPRTGRDREAVARTARAAGAPVVDGPGLFAASGADDSELFVDGVHPSPVGHRFLARAAAEALLGTLDPPPAPSAELAILSVEPSVLSMLGDRRVVVEVAGLEEAPVVTLGGAPLLDVRLVGEGRVEGLAMANGPGSLDVVVQTARGCAVASAAVRAERPSLELLEDGAALRARSRPGDAMKVVWSRERRARPRWVGESPQWVAEEQQLLWEGRLYCDATGALEVDLAARGIELPAEAWLQAVVEVLTPEEHVLATYAGGLVEWRARR